MNPPDAALRLQVTHERLERDSIIELELNSADGLLQANGRPETGAETLAGILVSARRIPERLTVRLVLPQSAVGIEHVEAAFHEHCRAQAEYAWQRVTTIRRTGRRQLLPSFAGGAVAAAIGVAAGTTAEQTGSHLVAAMLYVLAGICVIAAWVVAWLPIEELLFDWRPDGRTAHAYELLAASQLETGRQTNPRDSTSTSAQLS